MLRERINNAYKKTSMPLTSHRYTTGKYGRGSDIGIKRQRAYRWRIYLSRPQAQPCTRARGIYLSKTGAYAKRSFDPAYLHFRAGIIDHVAFITDHMDYDTFIDFESWQNWYKRYSHNFDPGSRYKSTEEIASAVWSAMTAGGKYSRRKPTEIEVRKALRSCILHEEFTETGTGNEGIQDLELLTHFSVNRRECRTRDDRMGLVPSNTQLGDLICIIPGMKTPFAIRAEGMAYRLVSECYIHGIMNGEAMEDGNLVLGSITLV